MNKKLVILSVVSLFVLPSISVNSLGKLGNLSFEDNSSLGEHVIEDVPYFEQITDFYCAYASYEMVFKYHGINVSQIKILHDAGGGYSLAYDPALKRIIKTQIYPSYKFYFQDSHVVGQGTDNLVFFASLYGCNLENNIPREKPNHVKSWINFWVKLKNCIDKDLPVFCGVDSNAWPLTMKLYDIPVTPLFFKGGHSIVIVGYNEKNRTVCFNDPAAGLFNVSEQGTYGWVPIKDFRKAVRRVSWDLWNYSGYESVVIEKISDPLSADEMFKLAHERNIERMKGNISAYDRDFIARNFNTFGINGLKQLKQDFKNIFWMRIPFYRFSNKISWVPFDMIGCYDTVSAIKHDVSGYLNETAKNLENETLIKNCNHDSKLMENESIKFKELSNLTTNLKQVLLNNNIFKSLKESKPIIEDICNKIDEIILIEEAIIAGPLG